MKNEVERLRKLYQMELLDSPTERDFDEIVHLASQITDRPMSLITLIDAERVWIKSALGFEYGNTERSASICNHTIQGDELFEVENLSADSRFVRNRFITGNPKLRYYAGIPLSTSDGYRLGALCVLDTKVRKKLNDDQVSALKSLARQTMSQIELRVTNRELEMLRVINTRMITMFDGDEDRISNSASIDTHTLRNFKEYGRLQQRGNFFQTALHPIKNAIVETITELYPLAQEKGISFALEITEEDVMPIDELSLRFMLRNVIHNAVKYSEGTTITIRYFNQAGDLNNSPKHYLSITDQGTGMQPSFLKVYEQGGNLHKLKGTRGEGGSGNGLLFVRYLLHRMGGKLLFQSEVGTYTTVFLII